MRLEIEVGAIGNAHQFVPMTFVVFTFREEAILNIDGALRGVCQLCWRLFVQSQDFFRDSNLLKRLMTGIDPCVMSRFVLTLPHEALHLPLLTRARAPH